jgi:hypothetical protein
MADNVEITAGTGTNIASDDIGGGLQVQRAKVTWGPDGTANDADVATGKPLPVQLRGSDGADRSNLLPVTANAGTNLNTSALALEAGGNLAGAATSLAILDDWDESDRAKVNPIAGQAGVAAGSGTVSALTQRVVLATDVALPAGTNNIGDVDLASIAAGETHIGEVGGRTVVKTITMTATTSVLASADVIADTQQLDAAFRKADGTGVLQSLTVFDPDDNAAFAFDVYVHNTSTSIGTENAAISISDANASAGILGVISFATTDAKDLINGRMYHKANIGLAVTAVSGTDDLYFSIVNGSGTPTFAGGNIPMRVGLLLD